MLALLAVPARAEDCLTFDTAATLQGKLIPGHAPGENAYWILQVDPALCVDLPPGDDLGAPAHNVREVQLVFAKSDAVAEKLAGQAVIATGHLSPPHGPAHRRPVVLEVDSIKRK